MAKAKKTIDKQKAPEIGPAITPRKLQDFGQAFVVDLTPERAKRILRNATYGDPHEQNLLFDEMLETDDHLASVYHTRKIALTGLDWEVLSALQAGQGRTKIDKSLEKLADEAADFVREALSGIEGFSETREHMADAIGRGTTVTEIVWDTVDGMRRPIALVPIAGTELTVNSIEPQRLRVVTQEEQFRGVALDEFPSGKFIVHQPMSLGGSYFRGGTLRASVIGHMVKRHGRKGWWFGIDVFGLPIAVAKHDALDKESKDNILKMLKDLGVGRGGLFPKGCEFEFLEFSQQGQWPHERLLAYVDAGYSKLHLGQTLTTQMDPAGGSRAAGEVHDEVRKDIRNDDAAKQSAAWCQQFIRPLVLNKFGAIALKVLPLLRLVTEEGKDIAVERENITVAVNDWGMKVPIRHAVETIGVPVVEGTNLDDPIPGRPQGSADQFTLPSVNSRMNASEGMIVVNGGPRAVAMREQIVKWSGSAAAFESRSDSNVNRLIDKLSTALAGLPEDAGVEDAAAVISTVLPEVDFTEMEQVIGSLVEASLLAGAASVMEGAK